MVLFRHRQDLHPPAFLRHGPDMVRRSPAAPADDAGACIHDLLHIRCKRFREHVVACMSVTLYRKSGVGFDDHRERRVLHVLFKNRQHLFRPHTAVDAQRIDAEPFQQRDHGRDVSPGQKLLPLIINHGGEHRQGCILFCGKHGGFQFIGIAHGLDMDQVGTCLFAADHDFPICIVGIFEIKFPHRFQELSGRTHIKRRVYRTGDAGCLHGLSDMADPAFDNLFQPAAAVMIFQGVCPECIGQDNIASGFDIRPMDLCYHFRAGHIPCLGQFARCKSSLLKQGSHSAVEKQKFFSKSFFYHKLSFHVSVLYFSVRIISGTGSLLSCSSHTPPARIRAGPVRRRSQRSPIWTGSSYSRLSWTARSVSHSPASA